MSDQNEILLKACTPDERKIKIVIPCGENKPYVEEVSRHVFGHSKLITELLEEDDEEVPEIILDKINKETFLKVLEFAKNNWNKDEEEISKPLPSILEEDITDKYNIEFVKSLVPDVKDRDLTSEDTKMLREVLEAANYLIMNNLLHLTAAKAASIIRGKSSEQIRLMFGLEDDLTDEEKERIREENKWVNESD